MHITESSQNPEDNWHLRETLDLGNHSIEYIRQVRSGDCGIATYLNTQSFISGDGKIPYTVKYVRSLLTEKRSLDFNNGDSSRNPTEIVADDAPLDNKDFLDLFASLYQKSPQQEDILTINGTMGQEETKRQITIALEYLDTYPSGICATNFANHARVIFKEDGQGGYWLIDPIATNVFQPISRQELIVKFAQLATGNTDGKNLMFFVRK